MERDGPGHHAGQSLTDFGAIQLTIDERYDYITVTCMKGDPLRAQKVLFKVVEGTDSIDTAWFVDLN